MHKVKRLSSIKPSHTIVGNEREERPIVINGEFTCSCARAQPAIVRARTCAWIICYVIYLINTLPHVEQLVLQATGKLVKHFEFSHLKDWQMKAIQATIEGRNTVIIQPTGSGKSLCFQLSPLISGRTTVVITPTISLMQDQTASLQEKGLQASYLGSTQKDPGVLSSLKEGLLDMVFVTQLLLNDSSLEV